MSKREIVYKTGDATAPDIDGPAIVAHICNDLGHWGKGFVLAVSTRWPQPELAYREWHKQRDFQLGAVQLVEVTRNIYVANMIGQRGIRPRAGIAPIRYDAVAQCLNRLADFASTANASVHMPRIGCGLSGGTWDRIEPLIDDRLANLGIPVTVYDLE